MSKKIGGKVVPVIIAIILLVGVIVVGVLAIKANTKANTTATKEVEVNTYIDKETGVKLESNSVALNSENVYIYNSTVEDRIYYGYDFSIKKSIYIDVHINADSFTSIDFSEKPVTAYIPCKTDGCFVIIVANETGKVNQLEAEYVDGYYKVQMPMGGSYYICDESLEEGDGELVEQTLVHDKTGVSATGMLRTNSKLKAYDAKESFNYLLDFSIGSIIVPLEKEYFEDYTKMTTYEVKLFRNLEPIQAESELVITLPNKNESCEVRFITEQEDITGSLKDDIETITYELMESTITDQEIADMINTFFEQAYPVLESDYAEGTYSVKTDKLGVFFVVPKGSFTVTAEDVRLIKEKVCNETC